VVITGRVLNGYMLFTGMGIGAGTGMEIKSERSFAPFIMLDNPDFPWLISD